MRENNNCSEWNTQPLCEEATTLDTHDERLTIDGRAESDYVIELDCEAIRTTAGQRYGNFS